MPTNRVRAVQGRRSSNAAGPHGSRPTRADQLSLALADQVDDEDELTARCRYCAAPIWRDDAGLWRTATDDTRINLTISHEPAEPGGQSSHQKN